MNEVPNIISTKDLSYIKDMASWNLLMAKKINSYIVCVQDEDVRKVLLDAYKMHKEHYKELMEILM